MSPMMVSLGGCGSDLVGFWFRWDFGGHGGVVGMVVVVGDDQVFWLLREGQRLREAGRGMRERQRKGIDNF